ncbi:hypothetical protein LB941_09370 [Ligilactobacillus sp. WILCCON 0076]|uniref:Uncharacterized protein n=1 Tax=Ligilactobacillus ubinensis TaxID=2876789 RepID=A0A9X2FNJ7_9LACO|nr:hypothetical protein [Ligilactobacillus ubinensis]MCP0887541.1 hypothetical protein [Ligilactobacillus ubinensis]
MLQKIREQEMIEEIIEDLKLQAGLSLSPLQIKSLQLSQHVFFSEQELKNHIEAITQYLKKTPVDERLWNCYQDLSDNSFVLVVCLTPSTLD